LHIDGKYILIDAGLGARWTTDELDLLDFERPRRMLKNLNALGLRAEDIDIVIFSHLHYDHSGGALVQVGKTLALLFTNAVYYVQRRELEYALNPDPAHIHDYQQKDVNTLLSSGQMRIIDGDCEIANDVKVFLTGGHSPGHQVVIAQLPGGEVFYPGDIISVKQHLDLQTTMVYDMDRARVLSERRKWLSAASLAGWRMILCHAYRNPVLNFSKYSIN